MIFCPQSYRVQNEMCPKWGGVGRKKVCTVFWKVWEKDYRSLRKVKVGEEIGQLIYFLPKNLHVFNASVIYIKFVKK